METTCRQCGADVEQPGRGRPRSFCLVCRPRERALTHPPRQPRPPRELMSRQEQVAARTLGRWGPKIPWCIACGESTAGGRCRGYCSDVCYRWSKLHPGERRDKSMRACAAPHCGNTFAPRGRKRFCSKFCSDVVHGNRRVPGSPGHLITCEWCGEDRYVQYLPAKVCSAGCREARDTAVREQWRAENPERVRETLRRRDQRRRAQRRGPTALIEDITAAEVYERDGWRCGLCNERVPKARSYPHPKSASLDHIVPLSLGGTHTLDNVQLAHLGCNVRKGVKAMNEQLLLVG